MGKPAAPYQQKLFNDEQLGLRSHDEIVRWIDQKSKVSPGTILRALDLNFTEDEKVFATLGERIGLN